MDLDKDLVMRRDTDLDMFVDITEDDTKLVGRISGVGIKELELIFTLPSSENPDHYQ